MFDIVIPYELNNNNKIRRNLLYLLCLIISEYFLNNYNPNEITSYSDFSRYNGNMYKHLGFKLSHNSEPNYYYIVDGIRKHRFNFRKDKLIREGFDPNKTEIEIMHQRGLYRIFDCGMQKWNINFQLN